VGTLGAQRRVALLLDSFDAAYQAALVRFVRQACQRRGIGLVVFPGGVVGGRSFAAEHRNRIYDLISTTRFDGLVVLAGTMTREVDLSVVRDFCERFRPMPLCSIGARLEGIPSYLVDGASGIRHLVRHLVHDHGHRRLAFIGGPPTNEEADERLLAFRDQLEAEALPLAPGHVVHGDFMSASGQTALQILLDDPTRAPQAIIAANDAMAMGALEALSHHRSQQAGQIAICGFDNVVETDFCSPPLTTVEQPLRRLAEAAIEGLAAQLAGQPCAEVTRFDTRAVFRRSCGCDAAQPAAPEMQRRKANRGSSVLEFLRHRDEILAQISTGAAGA
jgi:DNA-binding LacI/PurR family transcriptional regulator